LVVFIFVICFKQVLLDLARVLFEEQSSLSVVMETILTHTTSLLCCDRASILLADTSQPESKVLGRYRFATKAPFTIVTAMIVLDFCWWQKLHVIF